MTSSHLAERCTGIQEVTGSNPVQAWIFFRPYFHYCSSIVHYCQDLFHEFHIFTVVYSSLYGLIWNQHNHQLSVGRALQRYRSGHGFKSRTGLNVFFRPYFHFCLISVHYCEGLFHLQVQVLSLTDKQWLFYTLPRDRNLIFQPLVLILKA